MKTTPVLAVLFVVVIGFVFFLAGFYLFRRMMASGQFVNLRNIESRVTDPFIGILWFLWVPKSFLMLLQTQRKATLEKAYEAIRHGNYIDIDSAIWDLVSLQESASDETDVLEIVAALHEKVDELTSTVKERETKANYKLARLLQVESNADSEDVRFLLGLLKPVLQKEESVARAVSSDLSLAKISLQKMNQDFPKSFKKLRSYLLDHNAVYSALYYFSEQK